MYSITTEYCNEELKTQWKEIKGIDLGKKGKPEEGTLIYLTLPSKCLMIAQFYVTGTCFRKGILLLCLTFFLPLKNNLIKSRKPRASTQQSQGFIFQGSLKIIWSFLNMPDYPFGVLLSYYASWNKFYLGFSPIIKMFTVDEM